MLEIIRAGGWLMAPIIICSILSLTIIAGVSGDSLLRGALSALLGLLPRRLTPR